MPHAWSDEDYALPFALGVLSWQCRIPARVLITPWTDLPLTPVTPRWNEIPRNVGLAIVPSQPIREILPVFSLAFGSFRYVVSQESRYLLKLEGSFDQYMTKFGAKQRYNLRRELRRFTELSGGELRCAEYRTRTELGQFREAAMEISRKSPLHLRGAGLPESEAGWKAAFDSPRWGDSCAYMLFDGTRPVAYSVVLGRHEQSTTMLWKVGHDPEYAQWSPGTVLLLTVIERLFLDRRLSLLDFGPMEFNYKKWFATHHQLCAKILYFRPSLRNLGLVALNTGINQASEFMGAMLNELGVKEQIRTVLGFARQHGLPRSIH
jgi:hypothetical protein